MKEITVDTVIREKFHEGFERTTQPGIVVIHGTSGGGTLEWMRKGARAADYRKGIGLFHYLIQRFGSIYEIIDPERYVRAAHAPKEEEASMIHIEWLNPKPGNADHYTDQQYESFAWLVFDYLMLKYPIRTIMTHQYSFDNHVGGRKDPPCPGPRFDWAPVKEALAARNLGYVVKAEGGCLADISG